MKVYPDANVVVALLMEDAHSAVAEATVAALPERLVISDFTRAEVVAVISRIVRSGQLRRRAGSVILGAFDDWLLEATEQVAMTTGDLEAAERWMRGLALNLRTPDAIHLGIVHRLDATLLTFDRRMAEAARAVGVAVVEP